METCLGISLATSNRVHTTTFVVLLGACLFVTESAHAQQLLLTKHAAIFGDFQSITTSSPRPLDAQFVHIFEEPLIPIGGEPSIEETKALSEALHQFTRRTDKEDFSSLTRFLDSHPFSSWRASLLLNLGLEYFHAAYYSRALAAWEEAWAHAKSATDSKECALADRAIGEAAQMNAQLGRPERLEQLLQEVEGRNVRGSATELIAGARRALWSMRNDSGSVFRCGPFALSRILAFQHPGEPPHLLIEKSQPTARGFSLAQLCQLSQDLKMEYQMARRDPGTEIPLPAVIHWKVGHFAALLKEEGGRYLVKDRLFGKDVWISRAAVDAEASGYFLVAGQPLPHGWSKVGDEEGQTILGKGATNDNCKDDNKNDDKKAKKDRCSSGMAIYNFHLMQVALNIEDTPVGYTPPVGPRINFVVTYNQREANQPAIFTYPNLGSKWTFHWLAYITDNPASPSSDVTCFVEDGGTITFTGFDAPSRTFAVQRQRLAVLTRTSSSSYEMKLLDGSREIFSVPDGTSGAGRKVFLKQMIDPAGNTVTLNYDGNLRLTSITDAIGQMTTLTYGLPTDIYKITKVTDPFGRFATFEYNNPTNGQLVRITDVIGQTSEFSYAKGDFIMRMVTPREQVSFVFGESGRTRWLESTDILGQKERVEFNELSSIGIPRSEPASIVPTNIFTRNNVMFARNTFYWDKLAMEKAPGEYSQARLHHWLHSPDFQLAIGTLESERPTLESRIWYNYPGQGQCNECATTPGTIDAPSKVARVLSDGSTQLYQYARNALGKVTKYIDPVGRTYYFTYASNQIDLLEMQHQKDGGQVLLSSAIYNSQHLPLFVTNAQGNTLRITYNPRGQLLTLTDQRTNTTQFDYDASGYLTRMVNPLGGQTLYTYDPQGRLSTLTDPKGQTFTYSYDGLDRLTQMQMPDGTSRTYAYNCCRLASVSDTNGTLSFAYDALKRLVLHTDTANQIIRYAHDPNGNVTELTYPDGKIVHYTYDLANRMTSVTDWLGNTTTYAYDSAGRVTLGKNANGTITGYKYDASDAAVNVINARTDGSIIAAYQSLLDSQGNPTNIANIGALPVSLAATNVISGYDSDNRILTATARTFAHDANGNLTNIAGIGQMTLGYDGLNRLIRVQSTNSTAEYHYDALGTRTERRVNGNGTKYSTDVNAPLSQVLVETDSSGNVISRYVHGLGLVSMISQSDQVYYYHYDQIGTTVALTDSRANTVNSYAYEPFGQQAPNGLEFIHQPFHFVGRYGVSDEGNGLLFMRARYYSQSRGRFIKKDPAGFATGLNMLRYARNNSIRRIDPSGLSDTTCYMRERTKEDDESSKFWREQCGLKPVSGQKRESDNELPHDHIEQADVEPPGRSGQFDPETGEITLD